MGVCGNICNYAGSVVFLGWYGPLPVRKMISNAGEAMAVLKPT